MKILVYDISNVLYKTFYAYKNEDDQTLAGLAHHAAFTTANKYYNIYQPDQMIMCFDRPNWRKKYTKSKEAITPKEYKGNRRQNMTEKEQEKYTIFKEHVGEFEEIVRDYTAIQALSGAELEADDLIAAVCEYYTTLDENAATNEIIIISADQDLIQLLQYPNVSLFETSTGKEHTLDNWQGDVGLFLFEKCLRGDRGDNVQSAYPRLRRTKILEAYTNPMVHETIMHHEWTAPGPEGNKYLVKDLVKENRLLMDLTCQPDYIQSRMFKTVLEGKKNPGKFSYFHFMKFLGTNGLNKIADNAKHYADMLSGN